MANFQASARAVDMLGRQQIAGIPTAISEVFKNAYDAYATSVRGDFFPGRRVLTIRDNGIGMTTDDFITRWLTVGTDSKTSGSLLAQATKPDGLVERRQMGEKGIGRLAMATLGPQLLVFSRAKQTHGSRSIVVALVQWTLFEVPGLTLGDVVVPIREIESFGDLGVSTLRDLGAELADTVVGLGERVPTRFAERILNELQALDFDPLEFLLLAGPSLESDSGTAFMVVPVADDVDAVMEQDASSDPDFPISEFQRFLLGFTNTINPSPQDPEFSPEFYRHESTGPRDIIDPTSYFWEAGDFENTDHTVEGVFDEVGMFVGTLKLYGQDPIEVIEPWIRGHGRQSFCGPFKIKFGYVQGKPSESTLPPELYARMGSRLRQIGGLYVYRDGIRVLPYGNSDNDYLEVEKRRSLNAGRYYFSYRRMFGSIEVDSSRNSDLQEKAGREGFRENRAYRDFKGILQDFLIQLAAHFFSSTADSSEQWRSERDRLQRRHNIQAKHEKNEQRARRRFSSEVVDRINYIESGRLSDDLASLTKRITAELTDSEVQLTGDFLTKIDGRIEHDLNQIRGSLSLSRPLNLPLSKDEERDWRSYEALIKYADELTMSALATISETLEIAQTNSLDSETAKRVLTRRRENIDAIYRDNVLTIERLVESTNESAERLLREVNIQASAIVGSFKSSLETVMREVAYPRLDDEMRMLEEINQIASSHRAELEILNDRINTVLTGDRRDEIAITLKEQVLDLHEQIDANLELLQLGQAVQIVSHEFEASIRSVRNGLKALAPWARSTPRLRPIVSDLRSSFAHLDGYLKLFTPLQRRLYREKVKITGEQVSSFVQGVFNERLMRHNIRLVATDSFRLWQLDGYPSTFYPVFINLIDNAVSWVASMPSESERDITLSADDLGAYISDTGPGVRPSDRESIFERGFSRRRGGRGLGLSLAKELLDRDGWDLELIRTSDEGGAVFRISEHKKEPK